MNDFMRFGLFMSPLHPIGEDPNLLMRRDLGYAELADELNYDELWVGEHHSNGWATIGSPEIFLAAAAERTRRIKLATGVMALPYHHPYMAAARAAQLDQLTRGRFILGVGAGSLASDMHMLCVDPAEARRRTQESLETIVELLRGETVTRETDWFRLQDARIQHRSFEPGGFEITVSSASSPFGMRLAGRLGVNAMSHAAPPWGMVRAGHSLGMEKLAEQWGHLEAAAAEAGRTADRSTWRLTLPVHVAETREQALEDIYAGWLRQRNEYWAGTHGMPMGRSEVGARKAFEATIEAGGIIAGGVEDCMAAIHKLRDITGGFGCLLNSVTDWASPERTRKSFDLFARYVAPRFKGSTKGLQESQSWVASQAATFQERFNAARTKAMATSAEARN
ncbi:LLM class flavin-dependent oxidoreductase [Streptomyces sp. NPDC000941]